MKLFNIKKYFLGICLFAFFITGSYAQTPIRSSNIGTFSFSAGPDGNQFNMSVNSNNAATSFTGAGTDRGFGGGGGFVGNCDYYDDLRADQRYRYDLNFDLLGVQISFFNTDSGKKVMRCSAAVAGINFGGSTLSGYGKFIQ